MPSSAKEVGFCQRGPESFKQRQGMTSLMLLKCYLRYSVENGLEEDGTRVKSERPVWRWLWWPRWKTMITWHEVVAVGMDSSGENPKIKRKNCFSLCHQSSSNIWRQQFFVGSLLIQSKHLQVFELLSICHDFASLLQILKFIYILHVL